MAIRISKRTVDGLPPGSIKGTWHADEDLSGFYVVAFASGSKVYFARYRPVASRTRKVVRIGKHGTITPDQARTKALTLLAEATLHGDPAESRKRARAMPTFGEWAKAYIEAVRGTRKYMRADERFLSTSTTTKKPRKVPPGRTLGAQLLERWGSRPLDTLTAADVEAFRSGLKATPSQANRWLASVRACFSKAVRDGVIEKNPARGIKHLRESPPRDRTLTAEEKERLLVALAEEPDVHVRVAFELLVTTGARTSEVVHARWEDINWTDELWRIPSPKSGTPQVVPVNPATLAKIKKLPRTGSLFLFPGAKPNEPRAGLRAAWDRLRRRAELDGVRTHDLRRTFGLDIARTAGLHVASKLLRHSNVLVTAAVYAPLGIDELRAASQKRADLLVFDRKGV